MAKNRYTISVTTLVSVSVEADSEQEALALAPDAVFDEHGDIAIEAMTIDDVMLDGPAQYDAWRAAWQHVFDIEAKHGKGSPEYAAAKAAAEPLPSGI